jgi:hypothetical protein
MEHGRVAISVNNCFRLLDQSVNRVNYFSCITDNLTVLSLPVDWKIINKTGINYSLGNLQDNKNDHLLNGYKHFIQCYLIRDCVESFAMCLDELFFVLLLNGKTVPSSATLVDALSDKEKNELERFRNYGLYGTNGKDGKIQALKKCFGIDLPPQYKKIILSLKNIRDCLTHHNGIVREKDGISGKNKTRKFHWATLSFFILGNQSGKRQELVPNTLVKEESSICIKFEIENHHKIFNIGDQLYFTAAESYEIAFSLKQVSNQYIEQIKKVALNNKLGEQHV